MWLQETPSNVDHDAKCLSRTELIMIGLTVLKSNKLTANEKSQLRGEKGLKPLEICHPCASSYWIHSSQ